MPDHSIRIVEYHWKKLSLNQTSSRGLEPRTVFSFVTLVPVIISPKQTTLDLAPFFYRAWFPSNRNRLRRESNPGQFFGFMAFVSVLSSSKQLLSWRRSSIVVSFRATGPALTGNRTQDTFPEFWPFYVFFLVSRKRHAKFGANWFIRPRDISE
jgi:hypothetical protein